MIRNLLFAFRKLKFNSILLVVFALSLGASYRQSKGSNILEDTSFYSKENCPINFSTDSTYLIVIKNNKSCLNCFTVVSAYITLLKDQFNFESFAISFSDSTALSRKRNIYESKTILPNFDAYGVTYSHFWNESSPTPELLLIKANKKHVFSYSEVFADGFDNISINVQQKIGSILKTE